MGRLRPGRRAAWLATAIVLALVLYATTFVVSYGNLFRTEDPLVRADVARLHASRVDRVEPVRAVEPLQAALAEARRRGLKVSISGSRHSQGGHTYTAGGVVLDMRGFNRVREIDPARLTATVESGATWDEVQRRARRLVLNALVWAAVNRLKGEGTPVDKAAQAAIKAEINAQFAGTAALHAPDQIAGGEFDKFAIDINKFADKKKLQTGEIVITEKEAKKVLGPIEINSSIGSQWKDRAPDLDAKVTAHEVTATPADLQKQNMNARLDAK